MGLKKEPFEVDFFVDPKPLTKAEKRMISAYSLKFTGCG